MPRCCIALDVIDVRMKFFGFPGSAYRIGLLCRRRVLLQKLSPPNTRPTDTTGLGAVRVFPGCVDCVFLPAKRSLYIHTTWDELVGRALHVKDSPLFHSLTTSIPSPPRQAPPPPPPTSRSSSRPTPTPASRRPPQPQPAP